MATGRRRIGEEGGGKVHPVRMWVRVEPFKVTVRHLGWIGYFSFSCDCDCDCCFFFLLSLCVTPTLFVLFAPVLLSCLRAVVFPLFVLRCFDSILSLFCSLKHVSYYTQFIAQSEWSSPFPSPTPSPLRCRALPYLSAPAQIAELLHTVQACLVRGVISVLVRYSTLWLNSLDCVSAFHFGGYKIRYT
jgi:hypothetical protein